MLNLPINLKQYKTILPLIAIGNPCCIFYPPDTNQAKPVSNYLKIDMDGIENKVINGTKQTLADPQLDSLLIKLNEKSDSHKNIVQKLVAGGFEFSEQQVIQSKKMMQQHDALIPDLANYNFYRK